LLFVDPEGLVAIYEKNGIVFDAKSGVGGGRTEHAKAGAGEAFHFQLRSGKEVGPRINSKTFEPLTPEDERKFTGKWKKICQGLTDLEKRMIKRSTRDAFFGDFDKAHRRWTKFKVGRWLGPGAAALMSNSYEEVCERDVRDELEDCER
jgi:hypothetical protein